MAKRYGARVLIDGAQSVAHLPVNVQQLGCDFFVFSGHKIFGPTGIGAVYAKEELLEIMPPWQGGGNMIKNVTFEETTYAEPPAKFEAGTPNVADAVGLGARAGLRQPAGTAQHRQVRARVAAIRHRATRIDQGPAIDRQRAAKKSGCCRSSLRTGRPRKLAGCWTWKGLRCGPAIIVPSHRCGVLDWKPPSGRRSPSTTRPTRSIDWPKLSNGFCERDAAAVSEFVAALVTKGVRTRRSR